MGARTQTTSATTQLQTEDQPGVIDSATQAPTPKARRRRSRKKKSSQAQKAAQEPSNLPSGSEASAANRTAKDPVSLGNQNEERLGKIIDRATQTTKELPRSTVANLGFRPQNSDPEPDESSKKRPLPEGFEGSQWDLIPRKKIRYENLDLDNAYSPPPVPKKELGKRVDPWKWKGDESTTDVKDLPEDWRTCEPDLDPDDISAQIERCHERIESGFFPHIFKTRLKAYNKADKRMKRLAGKEANDLSREVLMRIKSLKDIYHSIRGTSDNNKQFKNVKALLKAYRQKKLGWTPGLVTYWSNGEQLCQPRPFNWDEFEAISDKHNGYEGFWVEGSQAPKTQTSLTQLSFYPMGNFQPHFVTLALRLPGYSFCVELDFLYDTGASLMHIFHEDLDALTIRGNPVHPRVMGVSRLVTSSGVIVRPVIEVEVALLIGSGLRMTPWTRVQTAVYDGYAHEYEVPRLDGPFLRTLLYSAFTPHTDYKLYLATDKASLQLPDEDWQFREGPWLWDIDPFWPNSTPRLEPLARYPHGEARRIRPPSPVTGVP